MIGVIHEEVAARAGIRTGEETKKRKGARRTRKRGEKKKRTGTTARIEMQRKPQMTQGRGHPHTWSTMTILVNIMITVNMTM